MYNPYSLEGKNILITGASSGIGKATAIECSKLGATVAITGRNKKRLNETFGQLEGNNHIQIVSDLTINSQLDNLVNNIPELDGCVNNAGILKTALTQFLTEDDFEKVMQVNAKAPILLTHKLIKNKKIKKNSSIVFTSSVFGVYNAVFGNALYSASKGALNGFAKNAALDLSSKKIRVNCVCPGMVNTDLYADSVFCEEQLREDMKKYPLKRYGQPEEVAYAIIYLLSDAASWVTGSNLLIDGGFSLM